MVGHYKKSQNSLIEYGNYFPPLMSINTKKLNLYTKNLPLGQNLSCPCPSPSLGYCSSYSHSNDPNCLTLSTPTLTPTITPSGVPWADGAPKSQQYRQIASSSEKNSSSSSPAARFVKSTLYLN